MVPQFFIRNYGSAIFHARRRASRTSDFRGRPIATHTSGIDSFSSTLVRSPRQQSLWRV
jgi:hypothetical protein